jgi:hypothetical protein
MPKITSAKRRDEFLQWLENALSVFQAETGGSFVAGPRQLANELATSLELGSRKTVALAAALGDCFFKETDGNLWVANRSLEKMAETLADAVAAVI